ncbi:MAG TPA: hypothetical protein DCQ26_00390 [Marinilabiliales bacterium]|jgi:hypothetical protein|nr:MAG: hypothetical protein A2W95_08380 [Bacteroidetes bacterium GWA2_40_14]OFX75216.1 MAG: hypothetical protein A2W96_16590 [Bacteroidetes bacterium GWD2_40_43]OFX89813.1 MAG: hypothetical protein A2W97_12250 [Bacteroidetes bacterium GWE2_40_63]OFY21994.1 MAG: hypothetical protein A2W88_00595 [Bacteroidetes bacterium GWF2_40_13]OFZ26111.1 MAG: hypothetical protein A2437_10575 [Bacteroidetes bacterium RIFOXYC2_FULL_40_12]HAM97046.1 hypothetical protein [Marinilabiliales bacterium]
MELDEYYKILNVEKHSSNRKIEKSYRKLALKYHPYVLRDKKYYNKFISFYISYKLLTKLNEKQIGRYRTKIELFDEWNVKYKEQVIEEAKELANLPFDIFEKKLLPGFNLFLFIFYLVGYILALILIFIPFLAYKSGFLSWYMTIIITGIYTFPLFAYSLKIYNREEWHLIRFIKYRKEKRESMKC